MEVNKYNFKTLKVKPDTYKKIVKCKGKVENKDGQLVSFDKLINILIEVFDKE